MGVKGVLGNTCGTAEDENTLWLLTEQRSFPLKR